MPLVAQGGTNTLPTPKSQEARASNCDLYVLIKALPDDYLPKALRIRKVVYRWPFQLNYQDIESVSLNSRREGPSALLAPARALVVLASANSSHSPEHFDEFFFPFLLRFSRGHFQPLKNAERMLGIIRGNSRVQIPATPPPVQHLTVFRLVGGAEVSLDELSHVC